MNKNPLIYIYDKVVLLLYFFLGFLLFRYIFIDTDVDLSSISPNMLDEYLNGLSTTSLPFLFWSIKQILMVSLWLLSPILILLTLKIRSRIDLDEYNWFLWTIFILFGIGEINFAWSTQIFYFKPFSFGLLGSRIGWCGSHFVLKSCLPIGALIFLLKALTIKFYMPHSKIPIIRKLFLRYTQNHERKKIIREEEHKKYCLDNYGIYEYDTADKFSREEILEIFWKILKNDHGYDVAGFSHNTSLNDFDKDMRDWNDLGAVEFIMKIEEIFVVSNGIMAQEITDINTFGELADMLIKKAKKQKRKSRLGA